MTLVFTKQGKPDTRLIDYNQAVVRLGLEKANAQIELDHVRSSVAEIGSRHAIFIDEVVKEKDNLDKIKNEVSEAIKKSIEDLKVLSQQSQESGEKKDEQKVELKKLESKNIMKE